MGFAPSTMQLTSTAWGPQGRDPNAKKGRGGALGANPEAIHGRGRRHLAAARVA
jgi:hypothetical protein